MSVSNNKHNINTHNTSCRVYAYVLNMRGQPLMPTTPRKARLLLKKGQARVVNRCPFIIQLQYATGEITQLIKLGTDLGYTNIGFNATTTDRVSNLTIACRACNLKKGDQTAEEFGYPYIQQQATQPLKAAACLNNILWRIVEQLDAEYTYRYVTKYLRNKLGLEKSHVNDAFVIAGGTNQERCRPYEAIQVGRNNRCLQLNRKGFKPSIRRQRYQLQPHDFVKHEGKTYKVKGVHCYGIRVILKNVNGKNKSVAINKVELITYGKGLLFSLY